MLAPALRELCVFVGGEFVLVKGQYCLFVLIYDY